MKIKMIAALVAAACSAPVGAEPLFVNYISTPGAALDATNPQTCATPGNCSANENRLSYGSDLYYDRFTNTFIGLADRGPGGGVVSYDTRYHEFTLNIGASGAIGNLNVTSSPLFREGISTFNGLNPQLLNGNKSNLGRSHDPEGVVALSNGNLLIADEYGPSVREFTRSGQLVRTFETPANLIPKQNDGSTVNYVDGRSNSGNPPAITSGRQDNRGFEGLAITPDGKYAYAVMQDPLVNEGSDGDGNALDGEGRNSRNVRIVQFNVATGKAEMQFIYQLETVADINGRIPAADAFGATAQGRNIGLSGIVALNDKEFLVLERDNRGVGVDPASLVPVGSKRVFRIDLTGATDVSAISLNNTNTLPANVTPVTKALYLDIQQALTGAGLIIPEKIEGISIGPRLANGDYLLLLGTDNDFSVTQDTTSFAQSDVCTNGTDTTTYTQISVNNTFGGTCPAGQALLPSYLYAFAADFLTDGINYQQQVPVPGTLALLGLGLVGLTYGSRRRRR